MPPAVHLSLVAAVATVGSLALLESQLRPYSQLPLPPFVVIGLIWMGVTAWASATARHRAGHAVAVGTMVLTATLTGLETWLWMTAPSAVEYTRDYVVPHPTLGYAPRPDRATPVRRTHGDRTIYDVTYTIGADGLRVAPPASPSAPCGVFFGDSFTFGEGVGDAETMPWQAGALTGTRTYNFGFSGYGPHQMLASLEDGLARRIVACEPAVVVFQTGIMHLERVAGRTSWDQAGPRYVLDPGGDLRRSGTFADDRLARIGRMPHLFLSHIYRRFLIGRLARRAADVELYLAVVRAAHASIRQQFPGSRMHVVFWDVFRSEYNERLLAGLEADGLRVHRISAILPGYDAMRDRYRLPWDGHPTAEVHRRIAEYLVREAFREPSSLP